MQGVAQRVEHAGMESYYRWVTSWPRTIVGVTLGLGLLASLTLAWPGLTMDPSPYLLNPEHPSRVAFDKFREDFTGSSESVLVMLRHPQTVFNSATLQRVTALTNALKSVNLLGPEDARTLAALLPPL